MNEDKIKADAINSFVCMMVEAFESGFVDKNNPTLSEIHRVAHHHVKDNYKIELPDIVQQFGEYTARLCGYKVPPVCAKEKNANTPNDAVDNKGPGCNQCSHSVGDWYERDCCFPDCAGGWEQVFRSSQEMVIQLRAQIESMPCSTADLERDAKRYRWLRERDLETIKNGGVFAGVTPDNMVLNGDDLDQTVDAAMTIQAVEQHNIQPLQGIDKITS